MSRSKDIGTETETAILKFLNREGFPLAKRHVLTGRNDVGDIWVDPYPWVIIEAKGGHAAEGASDGLIEKWWEEAERERDNAHAEVAFLVVKRKGHGLAHPEKWGAYTNLGTLAKMRDYPFWVKPDGLVRMTLASAVAQLHAYYRDAHVYFRDSADARTRP